MQTDVVNKDICLAVFPLLNTSDAPAIDIFCKGIVMDLITDLSRFRSFNLISYSATKDIDPDVEMGEAVSNLQLDYFVKGLVRYHYDEILLNLQLVNAQQNRLIWAEKFSGKLDELFIIQEAIVEKVVVSLQKFVDHDLLLQLRKKPLVKLSAYECWLKGWDELKKGTLAADEQARIYFKKSMEIDPHYSRAYTGMSLTYFNEWSCQIWDRWEVSQKGAFEWAEKAVELDAWDHISLVILGKIYLFNGEYDRAEYFFRQALELNPNDGENLLRIAAGFGYLGYLEEGLKLFEKAKRLNPINSDGHYTWGVFLNFEAGKFSEAIELAEKYSGRAWIDFPAYCAAAYYQLGNQKKMIESWNHFLKEFSEKINNGEPADNLTAIKWMMDVNPYKGKTQLTPFWEYISNGAELQLSLNKPTEFKSQFTKEGTFWIMAFQGNKIQMLELKGFFDIAKLLAAPHAAIHCTELAGAAIVESGEEVLDSKARDSYKKRIIDIQQQISEAESSFNSDLINQLQEEYDQLIDHLSGAIGLGGKARKVNNTIDKARSTVTWRIRNAIKKITEFDPTLGKHLQNSIKTGVFCEYTPEQEITWQV